MGILRDFINAMRSPACDGCHRKDCDRDCSAARKIELDWQRAIK